MQNGLPQLFKKQKLYVGDKQGFLNKYSDYEILYGDEFSFKASEK